MNPDPRAWQALHAAWRGADWRQCVESLRPIVEELPEVLSTRLLLAAFAARAENPGLALIHFEKLMVLAVGQGELFHALAAERGLSGLQRDEAGHRRRVQALQQWFRTVAPRARGRSRAGFPQSWLVELPAADFRRHAEHSRLDVPPPAPQILEDAPGVFAIVLHGEVSWSCESPDGSPHPSVRAAAGDAITGPAGCRPGDRLRLEPAEPTVLLRFDSSVVPSLRGHWTGVRRAEAAGGPRRPVPPADSPRPAAGPPVPDPVHEPLTARSAAPDRLREHELVVRFERGEAELGIAGTRTRAIAGRVAELSPAGLTFTVPRATVRQSRAVLEGAHLVTWVTLPGAEEPLRLAGRVASLTFEEGPFTAGPRARVAVEFVLLLAPDRARLQEALIEATRAGRWPWADPASIALDATRPAA